MADSEDFSVPIDEIKISKKKRQEAQEEGFSTDWHRNRHLKKLTPFSPMPIRAIEAVCHGRITRTDFYVYSIALSFMDKSDVDGREPICFASLQSIAERGGVSKSTVASSIERLVKTRFFERQYRVASHWKRLFSGFCEILDTYGEALKHSKDRGGTVFRCLTLPSKIPDVVAEIAEQIGRERCAALMEELDDDRSFEVADDLYVDV